LQGDELSIAVSGRCGLGYGDFEIG
jgi:hypothetical protein